MRRAWFAIVAVTLAGVARAAPPRADAEAPLIAQISADLSGAQVARGVAELQTYFDANPAWALANLRTTWMRMLMDARQYDRIDALAVRQILAAPQETAAVEFLVTCRARALLAAGKPAEALAQAKALYNVCSMAGTSGAMLLVAQCLSEADGGDDALVDRFRAEQTAGATAAHDPPLRSSVLQDIKIVGAEYRDALARMHGEDFVSLTARGNLMLLSDRTAEAKTLLERAYALASQPQLQTATESIARCLKATDGTIGRANAWVMSVRPRKEAKQ